MADEEVDEQSLTSRLMSRRDGGLNRRRMPDGGEVVSGPVARQALRALGARAFTMDETIFVDDDFDASNPEDAALYAHERHHQLESGGHDDGHGSHDAEEAAARAIERMVLHRSVKGESLSDIMRDVKGGNIPQSAKEADAFAGGETEDPAATDATRAYQILLAQGTSHNEIVRQLKEFVMNTLLKMEEDQGFRTTSSSMF